jgi:hypothetical protein
MRVSDERRLTSRSTLNTRFGQAFLSGPPSSSPAKPLGQLILKRPSTVRNSLRSGSFGIVPGSLPRQDHRSARLRPPVR